MAAVEARDDRRGRWSGWHPRLVLLIVFTMAPRAIDDQLGDLATSLLAHDPLRLWFPLAAGAIEILACLVAGILVDRHGVRAVVAVALVAWAIVFAGTSVFVRASHALYLMHGAAIFVGLFFGLAANVVARLVYPFERRGRLLAVLDIAATTWLLATPMIARAVHWPPVTSSDPAWTVGAALVAGGALLLAILWWRSATPREIASAPAHGLPTTLSLVETMALLRRPGVMALVLVMACHMLVFATLYRVLPLYILRVRFLPSEMFTQALVAPLLIYAVVKLAVAAWSDARARRTGSPAVARVPFIVAGAVLTAAIGLFPLVGNASLGLVFWPLALGMAAYPLVFALGFDIVPAALAGRFVSLSLTLGLIVTLAAFVLASIIATSTRSISWYFYLAASASLLGAAVAAVGLRRIAPVEESPGLAETIGEVFT